MKESAGTQQNIEILQRLTNYMSSFGFETLKDFF
jgi:hypothetical protein